MKFFTFGSQDSGYEGEGPDWPSCNANKVTETTEASQSQEPLVEICTDLYRDFMRPLKICMLAVCIGTFLYLFIYQIIT